MSDEYDGMRERFRELLSDALAEQGERYLAELAAGADAERAEWIRVWFLYNKLNRARIAKEEEEGSRPRLLN